MGMGLHEWPLMFFTVIGQNVAGAFIIMGCAILSGKLPEALNRKVHYSMFGLWLLMGIGFLLSMIHMGTPMRAFNSFIRFGHSSLSNEIASGATFFALGSLYWLISVLNKMPAALGKLWLVVVMILAVLFITAISRVYQIDTVPTWYNGYTTVNFVLTAFIGGPILAALLMRIAGFNLNCISALPLLSVIAIIISAIVATSQGFELGSIQTSVQKAVDLVPDYGFLMGIKLIALTLGLACWIAPLLRKNNPSVSLMVLGFILVFVGEFIGRGVFYGLHMTVGMAVVG